MTSAISLRISRVAHRAVRSCLGFVCVLLLVSPVMIAGCGGTGPGDEKFSRTDLAKPAEVSKAPAKTDTVDNQSARDRRKADKDSVKKK